MSKETLFQGGIVPRKIPFHLSEVQGGIVPRRHCPKEGLFKKALFKEA